MTAPTSRMASAPSAPGTSCLLAMMSSVAPANRSSCSSRASSCNWGTEGLGAAQLVASPLGNGMQCRLARGPLLSWHHQQPSQNHKHQLEQNLQQQAPKEHPQQSSTKHISGRLRTSTRSSSSPPLHSRPGDGGLWSPPPTPARLWPQSSCASRAAGCAAHPRPTNSAGNCTGERAAGGGGSGLGCDERPQAHVLQTAAS